MTKPAFHVLAAFAAIACLLSIGCSLRISVRLFNGTEREISVLTSAEGKHVKIAPGASAFVAPWLAERGGSRGFVVLDRGEERFYSLMPSRKALPVGSIPLPQESALESEVSLLVTECRTSAIPQCR